VKAIQLNVGSMNERRTLNLSSNDLILKVDNLKKHFPIKKGVLRRVVGHVKAVDGIDFFIKEGETVGLVGESGCGKSTVGKCIVRLLELTDGKVLFKKDGKLVDIAKANKSEMKEIRRQVQIIFQDPYSSLDPKMSVQSIVSEPLKIQNIGNRQSRKEKVIKLLDSVGLSKSQLKRKPHEFSGGQRQRIGIARSLAFNPDLIVCDEPVSALDVSVQAQVLNLLEDLQEEFNLTYLFIAHDLSVVEHISDRIIVMYLGKIVEMTESDKLYGNPLHPYTEALLKAIPVSDPRSLKVRQPLEGSVPSPSNPPEGCNFHTRCSYMKKKCIEEEPELIETKPNHYVACHYAKELNLEEYHT